jgi:hypothetical protein
VIQKPELGRPFPVRAHDHFVSEDNHSANGKLVNVKALPGAQRPATSTGATSQGAEAPRKDVFFQIGPARSLATVRGSLVSAHSAWLCVCCI